MNETIARGGDPLAAVSYLVIHCERHGQVICHLELVIL